MSISSADLVPGDLPEINQLVDVWGHWHSWVPSRIEDRTEDELVIAAPLVGMTIPPEPGDRVSLRWLTRRGVGEINGELTRQQTSPLASWWVRTIGEPIVTQRRRYARTFVTVPVAVEVEEEPVIGSTVDIGEGGVHCIARGLEGVTIGEVVQLTLEIDGRRVDANGHVLRTTELHDGFRSMVITFDGLDRRDADHIRRFVFASSLRDPVRDPVREPAQ